MKGFYPLMMKRQNKLIIPLFLIAGLGIVGIVCAQGTAAETNKTEREKSAAYTRELASRLESSGFDIKGTVIDPDGALLNDVKMDIVLSSPILPYMTDSKKVNKVQNINSEFAVYEKGVTGIVLSFSKKGYYTERRTFSSSIFEEDPSKIMQKHNIQVKMIKRGIRPTILSLLASKEMSAMMMSGSKGHRPLMPAWSEAICSIVEGQKIICLRHQTAH